MKKILPVYDLHDFENRDDSHDFYVNRLKPHVAAHTFTNLPHKHDFYLVMLVTKGSGYHEIDFEKYKVKRGSLFMMQPGQMHYWKLSKDIDGFVFFHSRSFFEESSLATNLRDFPFYASSQSAPHVQFNPQNAEKVKVLMAELVEEYGQQKLYKTQKLRALIHLSYIEIARNYKPAKKVNNQTYLVKVREFENLVDEHFKTIHSAGEYASLLNISEKHLNRITQTCYKKTSTQLIAERIILEAKRRLIHSGLSVTQIGDALGFGDTSYFVRFFKKNAGETPVTFLKKYSR
ncbi:MAG: AraC family transcriptional regulator [Bacteroidia bacterium]